MKRLDGHTRPVKQEDLVSGTVLRMVSREAWATSRLESDGVMNDAAAPFSDVLIIQVLYRDSHGVELYPSELEDIAHNRYVVFGRPYAFVSGADTARPSLLMGYEKYEVEASRILDPKGTFSTVTMSTGEPARLTT